MSERDGGALVVRSGYKQTEVGVIPEDWEVQPVGRAFDLCNNLRLPISQEIRARMAGRYPYYGATGIQGWINECRVEGEHALIGEDGDHFLKWRTQPMTLLVSGQFNVNNHAHLVRGSKNATQWFYWFFAHRDLTAFLTRQGAGRFKLTKAALISLPCALPPLPEQRAIAAALSDVDALIGALDRLIAKKRDLKQATMQQLLTGQTRLPEFGGKLGYKQTEAGAIPDEWALSTVASACELIVDCKNRTPPFVADSDYAVVRTPNVRDGRFVLEDLRFTDEASYLEWTARAVPRPGDIMITREAPLGEVCSVPPDRKVCLGQRMMLLRPAVTRTDGAYLQLALLSAPVKSNLLRKIGGSTVGHAKVDDVRFLEIPFPPLREQTAISAVLTDMDAELTALEARRDKTRLLKQGMMQELLTGKTRLV